jgi:hypothetical protein
MKLPVQRWDLYYRRADEPQVHSIQVENPSLIGAYKAAIEKLRDQHKQIRVISIVAASGPALPNFVEYDTRPCDSEAPE